MKIKLVLFLIVIALVIGFLAGRQLTSISGRKIEYIKCDPMKGSVRIADPIKEEIPQNPIFPTKTDTLIINNIEYIIQKVDTAAIIADYILKRTYVLDIFDTPENGKLTANAEVQYNKLSGFEYSFTPIREVRTITKERIWTPYIGAGYSTLNQISIGAGMFYHDIGIEYQFQNDFEGNTGHYAGVKYKF